MFDSNIYHFITLKLLERINPLKLLNRRNRLVAIGPPGPVLQSARKRDLVQSAFAVASQRSLQGDEGQPNQEAAQHVDDHDRNKLGPPNNALEEFHRQMAENGPQATSQSDAQDYDKFFHNQVLGSARQAESI